MNVPLPTPPRVRTWQEWFLAIRSELLSLLSHRAMFREVARMIQSNPNLPQTSVVYEWITWGYGHAAGAAVRRLVDRRRDVISLGRLLEQIEQHPTEITRSWLVSHYPYALRRKAEDVFAAFAPGGGEFVDPAVIRSDADRLRGESRQIKKFVDEHVAHHAVKAKPAPTFADLHDLIDALVRLANHYGELLVQGGASQPVELEDWKQVFRVPWEVARMTVERSRSLTPDPLWSGRGRETRFDAAVRAFKKLPVEAMERLRADGGIRWVMPYDWPMGSVLRPEANVVLLMPKLEMYPVEVVTVVVAHELAHLVLGDQYDDRAMDEGEYLKTDEPAWNLVNTWPFEREVAALHLQESSRRVRLWFWARVQLVRHVRESVAELSRALNPRPRWKKR